MLGMLRMPPIITNNIVTSIRCRYLLRDFMVSMLRAKWKKWDILDTAIEREGWKLLLLLRLSPMVPYNLLNIAMATTKMHFVTFSVVSAFGKILHPCIQPPPPLLSLAGPLCLPFFGDSC